MGPRRLFPDHWLTGRLWYLKAEQAVDGDATKIIRGNSPLVFHADRPKSRGLHLMQGPGYDQESVPGIVASGATIVVFTTGRGTTIGNAITPVIKLATNTAIFERMKNDLDLNAGTVIDGTETIQEVGERVFEHVTKVASGEIQSHAETTGHREFQIWSEQSVSV